MNDDLRALAEDALSWARAEGNENGSHARLARAVLTLLTSLEAAEQRAEDWQRVANDRSREIIRLMPFEQRAEKAGAALGVRELESVLQAKLAHDVLEWYHGDDELMPQTLVDQLTAEAERLLEGREEKP